MQPKSKIAAGLFAFLLGQYGVHNFYMGYTAKGVWQLILTIASITCSIISMICSITVYLLILGYVFLFIACGFLGAVSIWVLVEGIKILSNPNYCDARGVRLEWHPE